MSLIKCPECGHPVSETAPTCPNCGCAISGNVSRCGSCGAVMLNIYPACPSCHTANPNYESGSAEASEQHQDILNEKYNAILAEEANGQYKRALKSVDNLLDVYPQSKTFQELRKRILGKFVDRCVKDAKFCLNSSNYDEALVIVNEGLDFDHTNAPLLEMAKKINNKKKGKTIRNVVIFVLLFLAVAGFAAWYVFVKSTNTRKELLAWELVCRYKAENNPDELEKSLVAYLDEFSDDAHTSEVNSMLQGLRTDRADWQAAVAGGDADSYNIYMDKHVNGYYYKEAFLTLDSISFCEALEKENKSAMEAYISEFPDGKFVEQARKLAETLGDIKITDEEIDKVAETLSDHFKALSREDEELLKSTLAKKMNTYIGQLDPTAQDVVDYMHKLHGSNVISLLLRPSRFKVTKVTSADGDIVFNAQFLLVEDITSSNSEIIQFNGVAIVNKKFKILSLVLRR